MKTIIRIVLAVMLLGLAATGARAGAAIHIVAAENFYGDMARSIAGPDAAIDAILSNPNQDPHDFEASPATARLIADADVVIYNGADYDPWMVALLKASKAADRSEVVAAALMNRKPGDNPHLWYDPATMPAVVRALAAELARRDPTHAGDYDGRLHTYLASLKPLADKIAELKAKYAGASVTATEPVFGYMAAALGLTMRNEPFQIAVMNGTEPSPADVAAFEDDLKNHKVRVLFYNNQVSDDLTGRLQQIARAAKVPVVGVSETEPPNTTFPDWMLNQLVALDRALAGDGS
ncbi:MAG: metal ABC transporter solute-binding protein, Zn/Mn family [Bradyrhizobium sp.]